MPSNPSFRFSSDIHRFKPRAVRYQGENSLVLADCARLAYEKRSVIRKKLTRTWKFPKVRVFSSPEARAFIAANSRMVIISFRGTEPRNFRDWGTHSRIRLASGPAGKVHEGFQNSLKRIWMDRTGKKGIRSILKEFRDAGQSILIAGHSLGGALATLAVAELEIRESVSVQGLVTLGQPRTGDKRFARKFNSIFRDRCFRFVNSHDLVTRVPPRFLKYRHVGRVVYFGPQGELRSGFAAWRKFLDRLKDGWENIGDATPDVINNHTIEEYVRQIRRNRDVHPGNF